MPDLGIKVRSHVARDLLQSAELFKTDKLVIWEYVSNSLQYIEPGVSPVVDVTIDTSRKIITVKDNGRGMDRGGLQHFFVMHGENLDRKSGRSGRGRFGTGKSAAFGIASTLRVSSVRSGSRNTVELSRADIQAAGDGYIPVRTIDIDVPTREPNGTVVTVKDVHLRKVDVRGVIAFVERHLARWPNRPTVLINNYECEFVEPAVNESRTIPAEELFREKLGNVELILKAAKSPLEPDFQGVAICANGVWLETTLAGSESQAMANFIFGEIEVPALDDDTSPLPAFDMSRSMKLNPNNEIVRTLYAFIGPEIDKLRRELVKREKARRDHEEAKKLARQAQMIAEMINDDFQDYSERVARVKAKAGRGRDSGSPAEIGNRDDDVLSDGGTIPAASGSGTMETGRGSVIKPSPGPKEPFSWHRTALHPADDGDEKGDPAGGTGRKRRAAGGFSVDFRDMGDSSPRATYSAAERLISINLEHPQIAAALGTGESDELMFRRLAYEVAFSEYAVALAQELVPQGEFIDLTDPIVHIRETLNRMARKAAALYRG